MAPELESSALLSPGPEVRAAGTLRAFVALELSPEVRAVLAALLGHLARLASLAPARVRWTPPENVHLTLKFLGRVEAAQLPAIRERLAEVGARVGPLSLSLNGAGAFPDARYPQVLWIAVRDPEGALARLAAAVEAALAPLGFPPENRAFVPHLTLGRVGNPRRGRAAVEALVETAAGLDEALVEDGLLFFKSETGPGGAKHTPLFRVPLAGRGGDGGAG